MLQIQLIRENKEFVIERLKVKNFDATQIIESIIDIDAKRREAQINADDLLAKLNALAKEIGDLFKSGKQAEANVLKEQVAALKIQAKEYTDKQDQFEKEQQQLIVQLPNLPHISVPKGKSADDNEIIFSEGDASDMADDALPHWELASKYNLIDFELGTKIAGAGFPVYTGKGARLQRALINFFLDEATANGYVEVQPPYVVNEASAYATGQLPDKEGQMYHATIDNLYLIPTAEVPVTNIYRDVILKNDDFPVKNCAYSACFRREAGSYGKDVRGLNRLHQFDKVEIVQINRQEDSYNTLEGMKDYVASVLRKLELPFHILRLCGGDVSFTSALTYDLEVYSKAQRRWLEVSSVSNFEAFQANRLKLRYKDADGKTKLAHTLNGSALALPRIVAALLENNQTPEGIRIPKALIPYTGFEIITL
ncbi:MAG: serine--tRNA ligase [Bacteroidota bacterium]